MLRIRNPRDFWAGTFYVALALAVFWFGSGLATGSSARMGPGYFPTVLGAILGLLGLASIVRSFVRPGESSSRSRGSRWRSFWAPPFCSACFSTAPAS
jgi:Tripartite tricarboxylate transporter TctB family